MDIVDEIIKSTSLEPVISFFDPEKSAAIIKSLLKIYEEVFGIGSKNDTFLQMTFQQIVMNHSGWVKFIGTSMTEIEKNTFYVTISFRLYTAGAKYLLEHKEAE